MLLRLVIIIVLLFLFLFGKNLTHPYSLLNWFGKNEELTSDGIEIFSTYPFNHKSEIAINAGINRMAKEGMVVTVTDDFLIGKISEVFDNYSLVQTIFDSNWRIPVRIGKGVDALLVGGLEPKLTMISSEKSISFGDLVYSAGVDFPYGLKIGKIKEIIYEPTKVFKEATIGLPYNFSELRNVKIK